MSAFKIFELCIIGLNAFVLIILIVWRYFGPGKPQHAPNEIPDEAVTVEETFPTA